MLAKGDELVAAAEGTASLVPPANDKSGDLLLDWACADSEAELRVQRRQSDAHLMRAIEDALARINRGSFGVCEVCKQTISKARLEAVPWTRVCRDCKDERDPNSAEDGRR